MSTIALCEAELKYQSKKPFSAERMLNILKEAGFDVPAPPRTNHDSFFQDFYYINSDGSRSVRIRDLNAGEVEITSKTFMGDYNIRMEPEIQATYCHSEALHCLMRNMGFHLDFSLKKKNLLLCEVEFDYEGKKCPILVSSYTAVAHYPDTSLQRIGHFFELELDKKWLEQQDKMYAISLDELSSIMESLEKTMESRKFQSDEETNRSLSLMSEIFGSHKARYFF